MGWRKIAAACCMLLAAAQTPALVIDGKEVEDLYAYITQILDEDARALEDYRLELSKNPDHSGYRPYAYNALRHLSTNDVIYGALQGGLTAARELGPDAAPEAIAAKAEANIHRVMEVFPMLARDFKTGAQLLQRMEGDGRLNHFQLYLLRRSQPGLANPSLFSAYWQDELQRNRVGYIRSLGRIVESEFAEPQSVTLALPLFAEAVFQRAEERFAADANIASLPEDGKPTLTQALTDEAVEQQLADRAAFRDLKRQLADARKLLIQQESPGLQRNDAIKTLARELLAKLDAAYPGVQESGDTEMALPAMPALPALPESAPEESAPTEKPDLPRFGIPSLEGL